MANYNVDRSTNRLFNEITLGDGNPLDSSLKPIKVGGERTILELSSAYPQDELNQNGILKINGDLEVSGTIKSQPTLHILNGGTYSTGTGKFYLPLVGYNIEKTTTTSVNEGIAYVPPYDGRVKKLILRSEAAAGSSEAGFHKSTTGTEVPNSTAIEEITVDMDTDDTPYTFTFTDASYFNAGDIIAISLNPTTQVNDMVWTLVLEYYID